MSKIIYVASPYSHEKDEVRIENYRIVSEYTSKLVSQGHVAFSPITYGHHLVDFRPEMPTDWEFWKNFCLTFLAKTDELIVLMMPGWDVSRGVTEEIEFCKKNGIPVKYIPYRPGLGGIKISWKNSEESFEGNKQDIYLIDEAGQFPHPRYMVGFDNYKD